MLQNRPCYIVFDEFFCDRLLYTLQAFQSRLTEQNLAKNTRNQSNFRI